MRISTDSSDFRTFIGSGFLYVDKTRYVWRMVSETEKKYYFVSRPRRFGKSLMCSTLECLFKGKKELFKDLYIAKETDYDFEAFPVLRFNFALLSSLSWEDFHLSFCEMIRAQALENGLDIPSSNPSLMLNTILNNLEKPAVIIIDEFDEPVLNVLDDKERLEKTRTALSGFYSVIKNRNEKIRFFFITGITRLSNLSIFSKMNNLNDISMDTFYSGMFGFTEDEIDSYFKTFTDSYMNSRECSFTNEEEFRTAVREYYDGYRFSYRSDEKVYNPVSIGLFFSSGCYFENWWNSTGVSTLAVQLARKYDLINIISEYSSVGMNAFTTFDIAMLAESTLTTESVYALLFYTGYLTIKKGNSNHLYLGFPNREISSSFTLSLVTRYAKADSPVQGIAAIGLDAAAEGDTEAFIKQMSKYYELFPYELLDKDKEKSYQLIFHAFFVASGAQAYAEDSSLSGRADNVIICKDHVYICELKVDEPADFALSQIKEKQYYRKYEGSKKTIHLIGISFSSSSRNIESYVEEIIH